MLHSQLRSYFLWLAASETINVHISLDCSRKTFSPPLFGDFLTVFIGSWICPGSLCYLCPLADVFFLFFFLRREYHLWTNCRGYCFLKCPNTTVYWTCLLWNLLLTYHLGQALRYIEPQGQLSSCLSFIYFTVIFEKYPCLEAETTLVILAGEWWSYVNRWVPAFGYFLT